MFLDGKGARRRCATRERRRDSGGRLAKETVKGALYAPVSSSHTHRQSLAGECL